MMFHNVRNRLLLPLLAGLALVTPMTQAADDAKPKPPRAARSVHLSYIAPKCVGFYSEVTVEKVVPGSYFQVCGFNGGYFGIQEYGDGRHVGIFSVWDSGHTAKTDDPKAVHKDDRVETIFKGEKVRGSRFGGEGTGGHTDFDFDWKVGETYKFYLTSRIDGEKTAYTAYIFDPKKKEWFKIATMTAPDGGRELGGLYAFVEDFRRDFKSANEVRRAVYSNQWVLSADGKWTPITAFRFTASGAEWEAKTSINAGVVGNAFFLQTGGDTKQEHELRSEIKRDAPDKDAKTPDVPEIK